MDKEINDSDEHLPNTVDDVVKLKTAGFTSEGIVTMNSKKVI